MTPDLIAELLVRATATAAVVVGITIAVDRLGPAIGGALGGLPIVVGPGFYFLMLDQTTEFVIHAAISSLMALTASQAFLVGYIVVARRSRAAILAAVLCWLLAALLLTEVRSSPWIGAGLFLAATAAALVLARRFERTHATPRIRGGLTMLLIRGIAAGLLVAVVTVAAARLGPIWAGFLMTYPIALTAISVTVHQRSGADVVIATLRSLMSGIGSIAAFTFTLAITLLPFGMFWAFAASLVASISVTTVLTLRSRRPVRQPQL